MRIEGEALLLRVYLGESDTSDHRSTYHAIVELLRRRGIAGATVLRGVEGYGAKRHLHTSSILSLSLDLPIVIEAVDAADRIRGVLAELDALVGDGLIVLQPVEVVAHRSGPAP
jgi:PII-like signaling protein